MPVLKNPLPIPAATYQCKRHRKQRTIKALLHKSALLADPTNHLQRSFCQPLTITELAWNLDLSSGAARKGTQMSMSVAQNSCSRYTDVFTLFPAFTQIAVDFGKALMFFQKRDCGINSSPPPEAGDHLSEDETVSMTAHQSECTSTTLGHTNTIITIYILCTGSFLYVRYSFTFCDLSLLLWPVVGSDTQKCIV